MKILLGAVADDFTGATDLANTLVKQGMRTALVMGVPQAGVILEGVDAVVVALKIRTAPIEQAVSQALHAVDWLSAADAQQFFFKYCSTFDSTPKGNIGPVADALVQHLQADLAVICPAFPTNQRTVYQGHLFVGAELLSDSPMRHHPLTPMHDASLLRLMAQQSRHSVGLVPQAKVAQGAHAIMAEFVRLKEAGRTYAVVDALSDHDLLQIGRAIAGHRLITGGSGIALGLPENFRHAGVLAAAESVQVATPTGPEVVLAGSCSAMTRQQIEHVLPKWPSYKLSLIDRDIAQVVAEVLAWFDQQSANSPVLIYSSVSPDELALIQRHLGAATAGASIEAAFGKIAQALQAQRVRRMVVAGGETSGAVVSALGIHALRIGAEIDPGIPWTQDVQPPHTALALKSGNFGSVDFFAKAFAMLGHVDA